MFLLQEVARQEGRLLRPIHRLDRAASGVLLFGFTGDGARALQAALGAPSTEKEYLVLVRGETPERFESDRPLTARPQNVVREARTRFERLAIVDGLSLLRARLLTGRRHQIRRHLQHLAHQVVGDTRYGKGRLNRDLRARHGLPRLFLHAWRLALDHPADGRRLELRAPLAADLRAFLLRLPGVDPALVAWL